MNGTDVVAYCQRCKLVQGSAVWMEHVGDGFVAVFVCPGYGMKIMRYLKIDNRDN